MHDVPALLLSSVLLLVPAVAAPGDVATRNNACRQALAQADYPTAEAMCHAALAAAEQRAPHTPEHAVALNSLAVLAYTQGAYAQAEQLFQRALAMREQVLGPQHPEVATTLTALAALYDTQGDQAQAAALCYRAVAIREHILGAAHPATQAARALLEGMLAKLGSRHLEHLGTRAWRDAHALPHQHGQAAVG
jgi:tetratricopeptide (TPR) repeat protein